MLSDKETTRLSKLLSLVLRHDPAHLRLTLDEQGGVAVDALLAQAQKRQVPLTREALHYQAAKCCASYVPCKQIKK